MKLFPLTLAIGLALASTFAFASHHEAPRPDAAKPMPGMGIDHGMMGMMGMDKMSPEQHKKMMDEMVAQMDANSDGSVTKAEFSAHHAKMMAKHKEMMKNGGQHGTMMGGQHQGMAPAATPAPQAKPEADHKH